MADGLENPTMLREIAPVVYLATDSEIGVVESVRKNATTIASIFGKEDQVEEKMAGFADRVAGSLRLCKR